MSEFYPNHHNHDYPVLAEKGQKGLGGEKGRPGQEGRVTNIVYAFEDKHPSLLNGDTIPKDWEKEGSPVHMIIVRQGQSVVYTVDGSIWTYLPGCNTKGWRQTGVVSTSIYTEPGVKGEQGDKGHVGITGEKGGSGENGSTGSKGNTGDKGEKGDEGEQGFTGVKGEKGERGTNGTNGLDGADGQKGRSGTDGSKGDTGATGLTGLTGLTGDKGSRGNDGVVPQAVAVPVMLASFDGRIGTLHSKFNVESVSKVETGVYRFRLAEKINDGEAAMAFVTPVLTLSDFANNSPTIYVGRMTDRVVTVFVRDSQTNEPIDAWVNVAMFNPN